MCSLRSERNLDLKNQLLKVYEICGLVMSIIVNLDVMMEKNALK